MPTPPATGTAQTRLLEEQWQRTVGSAHPPEQTIAPGAAARAAVSLRLPTGFAIRSELGRGGFGVINLATQAVFERTVALKRLLSASSGGEANATAAAAFYAEALVTARLEHPNIVPVHDLVAAADGQLQLVMKCVEGVSWRDLLRPRKPEHELRAKAMTLVDHLDILAKVCDAVSFAHERGILHRDLKPENVMVGAFGEVQVMDWGCAVAFGPMPNPAAIPRAEAVDGVAGTPAYMAPEMARGDGAALSPASDVYLLGAILYEVLCGARPHAGRDIYGVLHAAAVGHVKPPQERAPDRRIPGELAALAMAALEREPSARIAGAAEFASRLKQYRDHSQAARLAEAARAHLADAATGGEDVDESFRRAISAAESAVESWPGWIAGRNLLLQAVLAHAGHCADTGAARQAAAEARRAADLAAEAGSAAAAKTAAALIKRADAAVAAQAARSRQVARLRWSLAVAAAVIGLGLASGLAVLATQKRQVAEALTQAESARAEAQGRLTELRDEQRQRQEEQKRFAPGLVAQARAALVGKRFDEALACARGATSFDPSLAEAQTLVANLAAARGDIALASTACAAWLALKPGDADALALRELCSRPLQPTDDLLQARLGELFMREHLPALAEGRFRSPEQRLAVYRSRLDHAWPGSGNALFYDGDGLLCLDQWHGPALHGRKDVIDLSPLRGMPFHLLDVGGTGVGDLSPLDGMPLETLDVSGTAVRDLSPLERCPLRRLNVNDTRVELRTAAKLPLRWLQAVSTGVTDLSPLRGMRLEVLWLQNCHAPDLSPLDGCPLTELDVDGGVDSLAPLARAPLATLQLGGDGRPVDLSPLQVEHLRALTLYALRLAHPADLSRFHLANLRLDGCALGALPPLDCAALETFALGHDGEVSLAALAPAKLKTFSLGYGTGIDLAPIAHEPLRQVVLTQLDAATWKSVAALRRVASLRTVEVGELGAIPVADFWRRYDAGEFAGK